MYRQHSHAYQVMSTFTLKKRKKLLNKTKYKIKVLLIVYEHKREHAQSRASNTKKQNGIMLRITYSGSGTIGKIFTGLFDVTRR
jgi:uncharacterized protein (UPF0371 family)